MALDAVAPGVPPNIALLLGPELVGVCINWLLWGILTAQIYYYFSFFKDSWQLRLLVASLYVMDSAQSVFSLHMTFIQMASGWGNTEPLFSPGWSFDTIPILSGIISFCVQNFFAHRIYSLSRNHVKRRPAERALVIAVVVFICLTAAAQSIAAIVTSGKFATFNNTAFINSLDPEVSVWLGGSSICDTTITITMVLLLRKAKQRTTYSRTHQIINKLIQQTVETGLVTAVTAIAELILFLASRHTNIHIAFVFMLAKLYTNTLLATLNSRIDRKPGQAYESYSLSSTGNRNTMRRGAAQSFNVEAAAANDQPVIQVQTTKHVQRDDGSDFLPDLKVSTDSPFSGYHNSSRSVV